MSAGLYIRTEEIRKKISDSLKGEKNPNFGKPRSEKTKEKISNTEKGKIVSMESRKKMIGSHTGKPSPHKGSPHSEEHNKKISKALWKGGEKESGRRTRSKRRNFDFIPLNSYQQGYVFHHLDKTYGVYMPEKEHRNIHHSVLRNYGMDKINALAWNYL